ncbi:MAG: hypothetical protein IID32_05175 [Planctomycetes bacterium]|nr:hypothetical protein [Planctomycetota bacterium]
MIARLTGTLVELDSEANSVLLTAGHLGYELMVPGYAISDLADFLDREVTLYCLEYYESQGPSGANLVPRLVGFLRSADKAFFKRFITVKGIGIRKALRVLVRPPADIAVLIEEGDAVGLSGLPEIGKRTAEQIVAELKGKMEDFALEAAAGVGQVKRELSQVEHEALEILLQLGERRTEAEELLRLALDRLGEVNSTDTLVQAAYRLKAGSF